jgi:hypothetical protein
MRKANCLLAACAQVVKAIATQTPLTPRWKTAPAARADARGTRTVLISRPLRSVGTVSPAPARAPWFRSEKKDDNFWC